MAAVLFNFFNFVVFPEFVFSEQLVVEKDYYYKANENDSKVSSRIVALDGVKKLLSEALYTKLMSTEEKRNIKLSKDRTVVLISGAIEPEIINEKWDGSTYYLRASISMDSAALIQLVDIVDADGEMSKDLEETKKESDRVRKELEMVKASKKKQEDYLKAVNQLSATEWVEKGYALRNSGNYLESIEAFNVAVEINPLYARAYSGRSGSYRRLGQHEQAIRDADTAIRLDPGFAGGYGNCGLAYASTGKYEKAIQYFDKAILLDPAEAKFFNYRGFAYNELGHYHLAVGDFNMAVELEPNYAGAYFNRGIALDNAGNYQQAIDSFKTSARLGYRPARDRLISEKVKW